MQSLTKYGKPILLGIALAVILVIVLQFSGFFGTPINKQSENPYEYNLDELKKIDSKLLQWNEVSTKFIDIDYPAGITVDVENNIYICGDNKVQTYNSNLEVLSKFNILNPARCIFVNENIYLGMKNHIEIYTKAGEKISQFEGFDPKTVITSIAVSDEFVFVADAGNRIVWKINLSGKILGKIGEKDESRDIPGFIIPSPYFDLGFDRQGELWVVNPGRHFLENYSPDGDLKSYWGIASQLVNGFCGCCNPSHFAVLSDGSFITSEKGLERVKEYDVTGKLKSVIAGPDSFNTGTTGLDIAVDSNDRVIVLDPARKQIRVFERK